jgi:hypothetical protein
MDGTVAQKIAGQEPAHLFPIPPPEIGIVVGDQGRCGSHIPRLHPKFRTFEKVLYLLLRGVVSEPPATRNKHQKYQNYKIVMLIS